MGSFDVMSCRIILDADATPHTYQFSGDFPAEAGLAVVAFDYLLALVLLLCLF